MLHAQKTMRLSPPLRGFKTKNEIANLINQMDVLVDNGCPHMMDDKKAVERWCCVVDLFWIAVAKYCKK